MDPETRAPALKSKPHRQNRTGTRKRIKKKIGHRRGRRDRSSATPIHRRSHSEGTVDQLAQESEGRRREKRNRDAGLAEKKSKQEMKRREKREQPNGRRHHKLGSRFAPRRHHTLGLHRSLRCEAGRTSFLPGIPAAEGRRGTEEGESWKDTRGRGWRNARMHVCMPQTWMNRRATSRHPCFSSSDKAPTEL